MFLNQYIKSPQASHREVREIVCYKMLFFGTTYIKYKFIAKFFLDGNICAQHCDRNSWGTGNKTEIKSIVCG